MRLLMTTLFLAVLFVIGCSGKQQTENPVAYSDLEMRGDKMNPVAHFDGKPFTGWAVIYTSGGLKHIEQEYLQGKKEGKWRVYFPSGQLEKEGQKLNGLDHGIYREWYSNGNQKYEYQYDQGKKIGKWLSWYEDGTRYTERNFENDVIHGKVFVWDEQGELAKEYDYVDGQLRNSEMHFENKAE